MKAETLISEKEAKTFLSSLNKHRGDKGFSQEEAEKVIAWATEASISHVLFEGVMTGDMFVDVADDGEVAFGLTEKGDQLARDLVAVNFADSHVH